MGKVQKMCERMAKSSDGCDASSLAGMLTSWSWLSDVPRKYGFHPACYWHYIGIARIFSGVHFSSTKKLTTFLA